MGYDTKCQYCGKTYEAFRKTSRFCSAKCRKRNSRRISNRVNTGREAYVAIGAIKALNTVPREELLVYAVHMERVVDEMRLFMERYLHEDQ